uniref:Protein Wnt n=1 Tax=Trichuris muris TaxID=70415 RepID=A0A5S6R608_TRIMR
MRPPLSAHRLPVGQRTPGVSPSAQLQFAFGASSAIDQRRRRPICRRLLSLCSAARQLGHFGAPPPKSGKPCGLVAVSLHGGGRVAIELIETDNYCIFASTDECKWPTGKAERRRQIPFNGLLSRFLSAGRMFNGSQAIWPFNSRSPLPPTIPTTIIIIIILILDRCPAVCKSAIAECQWQFRLERWNCTPVRTPNESISDIFATTLKSGSRESAFIEAISAAGLVHSVVSACTAGNVTDCSCDLSRHGMAAFSHGTNPSDVGERWRWGGCSDNIRYGLMFAREFLDRHLRRSWQQNRDARLLVTLHNHEVGRRVISDNMRRSCRCHGVSGSCEFKTCWLQMPKLTDIGERLKMYYDRSAIQVTKRPKRKLRRKNRYERKIPIRHSELVFHNRSPNYCVRDERIGTLGTHGRQCNRTSFGTDSCDLLCCGRGYDTRVVLKYERCHCKFVWCCYVTCKTCAWNVELHTCK